MSNYKAMAREELAVGGFTASRIAETFGDILLQNSEWNPENPVGINTLAADFIDKAATWPPKQTILGITIPSLTIAITNAITDGANIADVPAKLLTDEMCQIAVANDGFAIRAIPSSRYTENLLIKAIQNGGSIDGIDGHYISEPVQLAAVAQSWSNLKFIPDDVQTETVKLAAVKISGHAIQFIPEEKRSDEVLMEAVKNQPLSLEHIPDYQQTDEIIVEAVSRRGAAIQFVRKEDQSDEVLQIALSDKTININSISHSLRDDYKKLTRSPRRFSESSSLSL